jgi:AcrR family transcriptional regulator
VETTGLRARKKEKTRATIAQVALELFARDGFAATTLAAIAEAAEVSPRTVSTYFPSKEGIVFAAYDAAFARLAEHLSERDADARVLDVVGAWARGEAALQDTVTSAAVGARSGADEPDYARLRQVAISRDPDLWALERRFTRSASDMITAAYAEELGEPPDSLTARIAGESTAVALLEANARAAQGDEAFAETLAIVLDFIDGGLSAVDRGSS